MFSLLSKFFTVEIRAVKPQERMWMWLRVERRCWTEYDSRSESSGQQCCKHEGRWLVLLLQWMSASAKSKAATTRSLSDEQGSHNIAAGGLQVAE